MFLSKSKVLRWTYHARDKMRFYGLSEQRVRRAINTPKRIEVGIAPKTVAVMQPVSLKTLVLSETVPTRGGTPSHSGKLKSIGNNREETWKQEIWVMYQDKSNARTIISAWRYPGKSKPRSGEVIEGIKAAYNEYMRVHESR